MGQHFWTEHRIQLTLKHISRGHLVSPVTLGTELRDLCATFPSVICPGREEAQDDMEQNLSSWFKKNLVPCLERAELVCVHACAAQQDPFSHLNSQLKPTLALST